MANFWQPQTAVGACVSEMRRVEHRDKWPINTENFHPRRDSVRGKQPCTRTDFLGVNSRGKSCHVECTGLQLSRKGSREFTIYTP